MNKLLFLVLFAMVYLSMANSTVKPSHEKPIKISTSAPSASSVKPNQGNKLNEAFKKIVDNMKKVDTGIKGWNKLTAGQCHKVPRMYKHFRCIAYIPKSDKSKGWLLKLQIDVDLKSGNVALYNAENGALEGGQVEGGKLVPATYDFWSKLRDQILGHTTVNCSIHTGQPSNCDVIITA